MAVERGEEIITPNDETEIREDDLVTILVQGSDADDLTETFSGTARQTNS